MSAPSGNGKRSDRRVRAAATPIGGSGRSGIGPAVPSAAAITGGGCPAEEISSVPVSGSSSPYKTVAIESASKYCIFRSSLASATAGSLVSSTYARSALRIRPIMTAAGRPDPATSPTTKPSRPSGRTNTSYQSPPTVPDPAT